jgi:hypothetical protein
MPDLSGLTSGAELAGVELPRGRGYRVDDVEAWRSAALQLIGDLEAMVVELRAELVDTQRRSETTGGGLTVEAVLANLSPEQLRRAGAAAAGEALILGIEAAQSLLARAAAAAAESTDRLRAALLEAERVASEGRRPDYDLHRLVVEIQAVRAGLGTPAAGEVPAPPGGSLAALTDTTAVAAPGPAPVVVDAPGPVVAD